MVAVAVCFKDEEEALPLTIPTWQQFADELILLDTGSKDKSLDIALELSRPGKDLVACIDWPNDFSKAINQSMNLAKSRWVIRMDADELFVGDPPGFHKWLDKVDALQERSSPSVLLALMETVEEKWTFINWRARMFVWSDGWTFRFPIDAQPLPPEGVPYGLLCPTPLLNVYHLRESTRRESLRRNECYVWNRLLSGEPIEEDELNHYDTVLEICGIGEEK